jgi:predicted component of type VI protein secretion system
MLASLTKTAMPKLIYHDSDGVDKSINLGAEPILIGRANEAQIQTQDAMVSRRHARIVWDGGYWIEDLGSSNGVYVGHEKVQRAPFRPGDVVTCGSLVMRMVPDTARPSTTSLPSANLHGASTGPAQVIGQQSAPAPRTAALEPQAYQPPPQQQAYQPPPQQQAYQPPPQQAYQSPLQPAPAYQPAPYQAPGGGDIAVERKRREDAEAALLSAAERVKTAERRVAELESQLASAQRAAPGGDNEELTKLRRQVDQLTADLRRMRGGQMPGSDGAKISELTEALRRAEAERDQLRSRGGGGVDPQTADAAIALGDALAELRSSLRAASDESTVLTAPAQSVSVVAEALGQATEQLERARASLRILGRFLGVA